ncbi:hypothetical protein BKA82DRAFT_2030034 [Pisolithus tinctorius]|nr:hypothetical protein BKA82DRAFT_2030034 [Pisolithus tinctorius]
MWLLYYLLLYYGSVMVFGTCSALASPCFVCSTVPAVEQSSSGLRCLKKGHYIFSLFPWDDRRYLWWGILLGGLDCRSIVDISLNFYQIYGTPSDGLDCPLCNMMSSEKGPAR